MSTTTLRGGKGRSRRPPGGSNFWFRKRMSAVVLPRFCMCTICWRLDRALWRLGLSMTWAWPGSSEVRPTARWRNSEAKTVCAVMDESPSKGASASASPSSASESVLTTAAWRSAPGDDVDDVTVPGVPLFCGGWGLLRGLARGLSKKDAEPVDGAGV